MATDAAFRCLCGKGFESAEKLEGHMNRSGCKALCNNFVEGHVLPSEAVKAKREADAKAEAEAANKKHRQDCNEQSRSCRVALRLAHMRYIKMISGTVVDQFKELHTKENVMAFEHIEKELGKQLSSLLSPEVIARALETIRDAYDTYNGIRTEKQELAVLRKEVRLPMLTYYPRELPRAKGKAYDFKIDEEVLLLLDHVPAARVDVEETIVQWSVKAPERGTCQRIITDITDGNVFLNHPVLGDRCCVSVKEARACSASLPLKIAIMLYWDGFTVRAAPPSPPRPHPALPRSGLPFARCSRRVP